MERRKIITLPAQKPENIVFFMMRLEKAYKCKNKSQFEASEEHFKKTNNDVTINQNLTNSDVDSIIPTLETDYEFVTMADVSIVSDDFGDNEFVQLICTLWKMFKK